MHIARKNSRNQQGFTLVFAVIMCVMFSGLLGTVYFLLNRNTKHSSESIFKSQAKYLAESSTNRALALFNHKSLPDIDKETLLSGSGDGDDSDYDDGFEDDDDDNFFSDFDDDFDSEDFDFGFEDDEEDAAGDDTQDLFDNDQYFLATVPRFINFYLKDPYYVNIDSGAVVTEVQYLLLIEQQRERIARNKQNQADNPDQTLPQEIPIEELYFPLPEVNVQKIGSFKVRKGIHLKPGYVIPVASKIPVEIKQNNIIEEYLNYTPPLTIRPKIIINDINPNFAYQGDVLDIFIDGEGLELGYPQFSASSLQVFDYSPGVISTIVDEKAKPGRYKLRFGADTGNFYIVPKETYNRAPIIERIIQGNDINNQFIKIGSTAKVENLKIIGQELGGKSGKAVLITDAKGASIDIVSVSSESLIFNFKTRKVSPGEHYLTLYTDGGYSISWIYNVEKSVTAVDEDPFTGSLSTKATLLEVNSLSNLSYSASVDASGGSGRPSQARGGGRPGNSNNGRSRGKKGFNLLKSDLETVWLIESIAKVNKYAFKETHLIRRTAPIAQAALTTNSRVSFNTNELVVKGIKEASALIDESYSSNETKVLVEKIGVDPNDPDQPIDVPDDGRPQNPTGVAVIEDLGYDVDPNSLFGRGFRKNGIISVNSQTRSDSFNDFAYVNNLSGNILNIQAPGFSGNYFAGDEIIQFTPAVISPQEINDRESKRNLDPPGSNIYLPGRESFNYVFKTKLRKLGNWSNSFTEDSSVPTENQYGVPGFFGLNIILGNADFSGGNAIYGQGTLIVDTTKQGQIPSGGTVTFGSSSIEPGFEGVIYVLGEVDISGPLDLKGALIVQSPNDDSSLSISGSGNIIFNKSALAKSLIGIPFTPEIGARRLERVSADSKLSGLEEKNAK